MCRSATGLKRMSRKHMHFAAGELGEASVKSGLRTSAQIYVYLDVPAALAEGLVLYRSAVSRAPESVCSGWKAGGDRFWRSVVLAPK
jgi:hypothetical protein